MQGRGVTQGTTKNAKIHTMVLEDRNYQKQFMDSCQSGLLLPESVHQSYVNLSVHLYVHLNFCMPVSPFIDTVVKAL